MAAAAAAAEPAEPAELAPGSCICRRSSLLPLAEALLLRQRRRRGGSAAASAAAGCCPSLSPSLSPSSSCSRGKLAVASSRVLRPALAAALLAEALPTLSSAALGVHTEALSCSCRLKPSWGSRPLSCAVEELCRQAAEGAAPAAPAPAAAERGSTQELMSLRRPLEREAVRLRLRMRGHRPPAAAAAELRVPRGRASSLSQLRARSASRPDSQEAKEAEGAEAEEGALQRSSARESSSSRPGCPSSGAAERGLR